MSTAIKESKQARHRRIQNNLVAYSFIAPNFIGFAVFTLGPILFAFALTFMKWNGSGAITFAGLANIKKLFVDSIFLESLKNTIIYCLGTVPLTMAFALLLAIVLNKKIFARNFFRTVTFFPYVASCSCLEYAFQPGKRACKYAAQPCWHFRRPSSRLGCRQALGHVYGNSFQYMEKHGLLHDYLPCRTTGYKSFTV